LVEHKYRRAGALHLLAVLNTRTGRVFGQCYGRKRQQEGIAVLKYLAAEMPATITKVHIICDNARAHTGTLVQASLPSPPRFVRPLTPVRCSWLKQV
jgi:hypothetical protein